MSGEGPGPAAPGRGALAVEAVRGADLAPWLDAVAALRIAVFRDWPYLYDGDAGYERAYLRRYLQSHDSVCVLARSGDRLVGAATAMPLAQDEPAFRQPFVARGLRVEDVYYFGESVLLPQWRGLGLGHRFFDEREAQASALGLPITAFAAVDRDPSDPRRPPGYRGNDAFWRKRGYERQPGMTMRLAWKEVDDAHESEKPLTFWVRRGGGGV